MCVSECVCVCDRETQRECIHVCMCECVHVRLCVHVPFVCACACICIHMCVTVTEVLRKPKVNMAFFAVDDISGHRIYYIFKCHEVHVCVCVCTVATFDTDN